MDESKNDFQGTEIEKWKDAFKQRAKILPKFVDQKSVRDWFVKMARALVSPRANINRIMSENPERLKSGRVTKNTIGSMVAFFYDPKTKAKLPYYDRFPIGFIVGMAEGGYYGLNLHYLDVKNRLELFTALVDVGGKAIPESNRLRLSYEIIKGASKLFKPCFKHYLNSHVRSRFYIVPPDEWHIMLAMPNTERFEKGGKGNKGRFGGTISKYRVWSESRYKAGIR